MAAERDGQPAEKENTDATLKYRLLGPSLTKAGQAAVDQRKVSMLCPYSTGWLMPTTSNSHVVRQVSDIIYEASKGSKYFQYEQLRDKALTEKIGRLLARKHALELEDASTRIRQADAYLANLESSRDLSQVIVHVDCDAFFAAVEELDRPELRDVPMAVGKGVLTTCNYHARRFGVRSGMAGFIALKLCPQLTLISPNFSKYTAKASEIRSVFERYDPNYQSASVDEAYLNITPYLQERPTLTPESAVQQMRDEILQETHVTVSAGIAPNARLAKICSNWNKPNGQFRVPNDREAVLNFIASVPVRKVNGVGRVWERELQAVGIGTCADIYDQRGLIQVLFGQKAFAFLMEVHLGLGRTSLCSDEPHQRKSIGCEHTFGDVSDMDDLIGRLRGTAEQLALDLAKKDLRGRTLVLKIKLHTYEVLSRQTVPASPIYAADDIFQHALPMLLRLKKEVPGLTLRLMGLRCTNLVPRQVRENVVMSRFLAQSRAPESSMTAAECDIQELQGKADQDLDDEVKRHASELVDSQNRTSTNRVLAKQADGGAATTTVEYVPRSDDQPPTIATYTCPICGSQQPADDLSFNQHIDFCLSRDAIRCAVESEGNPNVPAASGTPAQMTRRTGQPKRGQRAHEVASQPPRKKLFFG
ncbi:hypothetical protein KEM52_004666 [Ascosphaera acerosa]|nr:hypothetical protein KEM52_004666 [Ascosphaera acerosa]